VESGDSRESSEEGRRGGGGKVDSVTIVDEGDFSKTFLMTMEVYVEEERASVEVKGRR